MRCIARNTTAVESRKFINIVNDFIYVVLSTYRGYGVFLALELGFKKAPRAGRLNASKIASCRVPCYLAAAILHTRGWQGPRAGKLFICSSRSSEVRTNRAHFNLLCRCVFRPRTGRTGLYTPKIYWVSSLSGVVFTRYFLCRACKLRHRLEL